MSLSPELLDTYIKRSGTRLVDDNLPLINQCVARWRSFCFIARKVKPCYPIFAALKAFRTSDAPQLQFIAMDVGNEKMDDNLLLDTQIRKFEGGAPMLTYLKGDGLSLNLCCPPLVSLTPLELRHRWKRRWTANQDLRLVLCCLMYLSIGQ